ncbi:MAG: hypothetical protein IE879_07880 [Sulfuricurvum sp.]|nr:hypothetical protein [Sulfuricurvum sp.]
MHDMVRFWNSSYSNVKKRAQRELYQILQT